MKNKYNRPLEIRMTESDCIESGKKEPVLNIVDRTISFFQWECRMAVLDSKCT